MKIKIYQVDAFTSELFGGNPAAVCPLDEWLDTQTLQLIAAENNLSETAFYVKKKNHFELRWFTPEIEVDLCGHATLASGHIIFNYSNYDGKKIRFLSKSGELNVTQTEDLLTLDFPATMPQKLAEIPGELTEILGKPPTDLFKSRDLLALYDNEEEILSIHPKFEKLNRFLLSIHCLGLIITAPGHSSDFVSRFFAPPAGIDEDPVTGSAHTTLTPFWAKKLNKKKLIAFQLSKRRGKLFLEHAGERVFISGKAVTYLTGVIEI